LVIGAVVIEPGHVVCLSVSRVANMVIKWNDRVVEGGVSLYSYLIEVSDLLIGDDTAVLTACSLYGILLAVQME
jgi:hypothetical protein